MLRATDPEGTSHAACAHTLATGCPRLDDRGPQIMRKCVELAVKCGTCGRTFKSRHTCSTHQGKPMGCHGVVDSAEEVADEPQPCVPAGVAGPNRAPEVHQQQPDSFADAQEEAPGGPGAQPAQPDTLLTSALQQAQQELLELAAQRQQGLHTDFRTPTLETELIALLTRHLSGTASAQPSMLHRSLFNVTPCVRSTAAAEIANFLQLFRKYEHESYRPSPQLRNFPEWQAYLTAAPRAGSEYEHHNIAAAVGAHEPLFVSVRLNLSQTLLNMISNGTEQPVLYPELKRDPITQERLYDEQYTGDHWLHLQVLYCSWPLTSMHSEISEHSVSASQAMARQPVCDSQELYDRQHGRRLPILLLNMWSGGSTMDKAGCVKVRAVTASFGKVQKTH